MKLVGWIAMRLRSLHWSINLLLFATVLAVVAWLLVGSPSRGGGYLSLGESLLVVYGGTALAVLFARMIRNAGMNELSRPEDTDRVWASRLAVPCSRDVAWAHVRDLADTLGHVDDVDDTAHIVTFQTSSWIRATRFWIEVADADASAEVITKCAGFSVVGRADEVDLNDAGQRVEDRVAAVLLPG